jgi:hypothetical protein
MVTEGPPPKFNGTRDILSPESVSGMTQSSTQLERT